MLESGDVNVVDKINVEAGWECTTCQACTEVCPVGNHVEKADEIRSFQVLAEGEMCSLWFWRFPSPKIPARLENGFPLSVTLSLTVSQSCEEFHLPIINVRIEILL